MFLKNDVFSVLNTYVIINNLAFIDFILFKYMHTLNVLRRSISVSIRWFDYMIDNNFIEYGI